MRSPACICLYITQGGAAPDERLPCVEARIEPAYGATGHCDNIRQRVRLWQLIPVPQEPIFWSAATTSCLFLPSPLAGG